MPPQIVLWIFEDQLSVDLSILKKYPTAPILMIESAHTFRMWKYHKKRIVFLISAMRHFRDELVQQGRTVHYYPLKKTGYKDSLSALKHLGQKHFHIVEPTEHHTRVWLETLNLKIDFAPNEMFLTDRIEFANWARSLKSPLMENFYRRMRVQHNVLMDSGKPAGGAWNLDKLNRKPPGGSLLIPPSPYTKPDAITQQVMKEVDQNFPDHPGKTKGFDYPVTRQSAESELEHFLTHRLPLFGDYEDAMLTGQPVLYHSRLSAPLNAGLLSPMQCIRGAEKQFKQNKAPLNAVEGFIRQILGWREYMYGIYQTYMPEYRNRNSRHSTTPLPDFFWTGNSEMNCLKQTITDVVENAYSHHIQRLMIICNLATLVGLSPQAVNDWFLQMYIDSHDWVVTPNVIGMGLNADGGTCATKPYVSSANYINRMSDYCGGCKFNPTQRTGPDACPFNYLYWTFLETNRKVLAKNPRIMMVLKNLDRLEPAELNEMRQKRQHLLKVLQPTGKY